MERKLKFKPAHQGSKTIDVDDYKIESHAFPGGYPIFYYVKSDDGHLHACPSCVKGKQVGCNITKLDAHINYEDETLTCDCCECPIESAYGES